MPASSGESDGFPDPAAMMGLETGRLLLRPMRPSDTEAFFAFGGDPKAMRFTHCHTSVRECRRRLAAFEWQRRKRGYAPWAVIAKTNGRLIGWGGVYIDPFDAGWGPELGYFFHPAAWGQGLATELAYACVEWADEVPGTAGGVGFCTPGQCRVTPRT